MIQFICRSTDRKVAWQPAMVLLGLGLAILLPVHVRGGQQVGRGRVLQPAPPQRIMRGGLIDDLQAEQPLPQGQDSGGASLKTDPDLEQWLELAERYREDGNYSAAAQFWQAVLDRSGDALFSDDDQTYYSLVQRVEEILAGLSEEGLSTYRIKADANAKEILAAAGDSFDVRALNQIVRQYFISSLGDEAALTLSSIYLDRYDFVGAYRLLQKVIRQYPDPTVSMSDVYIKMALCESYFGEAEAARRSLELAGKAGGGDQRRIEMVSSTIGQLGGTRNITADDGLRMPMSNPIRYGVMPRLPDNVLADEMRPVWQYYFSPEDKIDWDDYKQVTVLSDDQASGSGVEDTVSKAEQDMIDSWRTHSWRPTGQLLFDQGRVYLKTPVDTIVWDSRNLSREYLWRPLWRNAFKVDDYTSLMNIVLRNMRRGRLRQPLLNTGKPFKDREIQLYGDRIASQMSLLNGVLYSIEGKRFDENMTQQRGRQRSPYNSAARRSRNNFLTAYDSASGKLLWSLPQTNQAGQPVTPANTDPDQEAAENPYLVSGGFMAAPIPYRDWVIVPVNQGGAISIYALDPQDRGRTVWKAFLCDEPESGANPWAPVNLSIDGSDLFATCGLGVVFVLDPSTGMIRFAKRYERQGSVAQDMRRWGPAYYNLRTYKGWSEDTVIPYGRQMICFCSDTNRIEAFDRNNGQLIWQSENSPLNFKVDYLLGVYNDVLYAAGPETIIGYDLLGEGRIILGGEQLFSGEKSYGHGMLTPGGIFMPVGNKIVQFDLKGDSDIPQVVAQAHVELGTGAPLGNLFSDGEKIWVHGGNRLFVLAKTPVKQASDEEDTQ